MSYLDKASLKVVGTRPIRPDGVDKVTGRAKFGADANAPGMLIGKILRSTRSDALIFAVRCGNQPRPRRNALAGQRAGLESHIAVRLRLSAAYQRVWLMFRLSTIRSCSGLRDHSSRVISTENFRKKKIELPGDRDVAPNDNIFVNGRRSVSCSFCIKRRVSDRCSGCR